MNSQSSLRMENSLRNRIEINPKILGGKPVIRKTRIPIYIILQMLQDGLDFQGIISEYPRLEVEDIRAAIEYAILRVNEEELELAN